MDQILKIIKTLTYEELSNLANVVNAQKNKCQKDNIKQKYLGSIAKIVQDYEYKIVDNLDECDGGELEHHLKIVFRNGDILELYYGAEGEFYKTNNEHGYDFSEKYTCLKFAGINEKNYSCGHLIKMLNKILELNNVTKSERNYDRLISFIKELFKQCCANCEHFNFEDDEIEELLLLDTEYLNLNFDEKSINLNLDEKSIKLNFDEKLLKK